MSEWYEVNNPTRLAVIAAVALVVGFGAGWVVNGEIHGDDVCDFARESYETVVSQPEDDTYMAARRPLPDGSGGLEAHVLGRYVIACGSEADIEALKDQYFIP